MQREEKPGTLLLSGFNVAKGVASTIWAVFICPHNLLLSLSPVSQPLLVKTDVGSVALLQLQLFRSVALGSDAGGQHPTELDPHQLAQPHVPNLGVGSKGRKKRSTRELGWGSEMERRIGGAIFAHGPAGISPWELLR